LKKKKKGGPRGGYNFKRKNSKTCTKKTVEKSPGAKRGS